MPQLEDLGWLVGIIEGEGCLSCRAAYDKRDDRTRVSLRLNISSSSIDIVNNIKRIYDEMEVVYSIRIHKPKNINWKDVYHVDVQSFKGLLRVLLPTVSRMHSGKKEIANAMLIYIKNRMDKGDKEYYDDIDMMLANNIRHLCTEHNIKKGTIMGGDIL